MSTPGTTRVEPACHSADVETGTGSPVAAGGSPAQCNQTTITVAPPSPSVLEGLRWSLNAAASEFGEGSYDREAREWLDKVEEACKRG